MPTNKGKNCNFYKDGRTLKKNYCIDCGKEIYYDAKRCKSCSKKGRRNPVYKDGRTLKQYYCVDCGKELNGYTSKRCLLCSNKGRNNPAYIEGKSLKKYYCMDCEKELSIGAKRCASCDAKVRWQNLEYRKKQIESITESHNRIEVKEKNSKITKERWQNGGFDGVFKSPTMPEKKIMNMLKDLKINYIFQFRPKGYSKPYDFYIPFINLLIEYDSKYWHRNTQARDKEKTEYARNNGYNLLRFNETTLDNFENIILRGGDYV